MLNPFELIPIVNNVPCKIESIEIWANNIYLGTNDGQILLYIIERVENNKKVTFKSRMEKKKSLNHGKKPVEKLLLMAEIGKLLTLCDGNLDIFSMYNLDSSNGNLGISTNKGVITFCSKKKSPEFKICVVTKRKLTFYEFVGVFEMYKEAILPDVALTVEWCKNSICLGSKKEYAIMNVDQESYKQLIPLDKNSPEPKTKLILDQEKFLICATSDLSIMVDLEGDISQGTIQWSNENNSSNPPISMSYLEPYLITILQNKNIEIHDMKDQKLVQQLNSNSGSGGKSNQIISFQQVFEGRGNGKDFIVLYSSNPNSVYCLHLGNIDDLVNSLISKGEHEEAIRLFEIFFKRERSEFEDTYDQVKEKQIHQQRLCKVYESVAMAEFFKFKFQSAFKYLALSLLDHRAIISFFPTYMPYQTNYRSPFDQSDIFKSIKDSSISNSPNSIDPKDKDILIEDSKNQLMLYLENYLSNFDLSNLNNIKSNVLGVGVGVGSGSSSGSSGSGIEIFKDLTTVLLKLYSESNKISKLISLLSKCRICLINSSLHSNGQAQAQVQQTPLTINNLFYIQDVEEWLNNRSLYKQLGLVFQYTEKYRKALLLWNRLSIGELTDNFNCNGIDESIQLLECKQVTTSLSTYSVPSNKQPSTTQQLYDLLPEPSKDLIWEFSPYLLKNSKNIENSMKIFLKKRKDSLVIDDVIEFLLQFGEVYYQMYLEYLIFEEENKTDYLHTRLATSYIDQIFKNSPELQSSQDRNDIPIANSDRKKLIVLLEFSNYYNAPTLLNRVRNSLLYEELVILYLRIGQYEKMFNIIVWKLNDFEKAENICESFDPEISLSVLLPTTTGATTTTPVTTTTTSPSLHSHTSDSYRNSIRLINVQPSTSPLQGFNLNNSQSSSSSSQPITDPSNLPKATLYDPKRQELFLCLLKTYLNYKEHTTTPTPSTSSGGGGGSKLSIGTTKTRINQLTKSIIKDNQGNPIIPSYIIEFLNKFYEEMDPIKVLALLPNSVPIDNLKSYLSNSFNYSISQQRESKIVKNLQKSLNLSTKFEYMKVSSSSVCISSDRRCAVCSKPISDRVFVYFPNGTIVHPKCFQIPFICPISARNFKLDPVEFPQSI